MVAFRPLDAVLDQTGRGLLERGRLKALFRVEEAGSALPSGAIPAKAVRIDATKVP